jgi:hypothetical protein
MIPSSKDEGLLFEKDFFFLTGQLDILAKITKSLGTFQNIYFHKKIVFFK